MSNLGQAQGNQFKTLIYEKELDLIALWVKEYPNLETGGDLFGFWTHSGFPVIQFVLGPGKNSRHNHASFYQDKEHLIQAGEILRARHGLQHIGEWHSHHQIGLAQPSSGDEQTVFNGLKRYNFPKFLLCIANLRPEKEGYLRTKYQRTKYQVNIGCFLFAPSWKSYQTGRWVVLPGQSPIRKDLEWGEAQSLLKTPELNANWNVEQTTLEEQQLVSTEPIQISNNIWYSTPEGRAVLKTIHDVLKNNYQNCEMCRTPSEEIYFKFEKKLSSGNVDRFRLELPNNFPQSPPLIKVNDCLQPDLKIKDLCNAPEQWEQIQIFINQM